MYPILPIYQTKTSLGLTYIPRVLSDRENDIKGRSPGILITIASKEGGRYDTENASMFSLGYYDAIEVLRVKDHGYPSWDKAKEKGYISLVHKYSGQTKTLWIKEGDLDRNDRPTVGWGLSVDGVSKVVYCLPHHMDGIFRYLDRCIDQMITG